MALGSIFKAVGAGARSLQQDREREKAQQMLLEDRLAQKDMRDLQKRKLEDELNRPNPMPTWDTRETRSGEYFQVDPRTGSTRRVTLDGQPVLAPEKPEPLEVVLGQGGQRVYTPRSQAAGKTAPEPAEPLVQVATPDGPVYKPRSQAVGAQAPQPAAATGAADAKKKAKALDDLLASLDSFEQTLTTTGSAVMPSAGKDVLQTVYNDALLKAKEAYNLGALAGPDLALMQKVLGDPTSLKGRALALGSGDEQTTRALAQLRKLRQQFKSQRDGISGGAGSPDHSAMSDEEFAKAWAAGQFRKP